MGHGDLGDNAGCVVIVAMFFALLIVLSYISYLNGNRDHQVQISKINACAHTADVAACIKAVK